MHNPALCFIIETEKTGVRFWESCEIGCGALSTHQYILPDEPAVCTKARLLYVTSTQYNEQRNFALHIHTCAELFSIAGGHGVFQVPQQHFPVAINDLVFVRAGIPHAKTSQNGSLMKYRRRLCGEALRQASKA